MSNDWEAAYGFNPHDPAVALLDTDGDGLTNLEEYQLGTHPLNGDIDGNGLKDGLEIGYG